MSLPVLSFRSGTSRSELESNFRSRSLRLFLTTQSSVLTVLVWRVVPSASDVNSNSCHVFTWCVPHVLKLQFVVHVFTFPRFTSSGARYLLTTWPSQGLFHTACVVRRLLVHEATQRCLSCMLKAILNSSVHTAEYSYSLERLPPRRSARRDARRYVASSARPRGEIPQSHARTRTHSSGGV